MGVGVQGLGVSGAGWRVEAEIVRGCSSCGSGHPRLWAARRASAAQGVTFLGHSRRTKQGSGGDGWSHLRWDRSGVRPPRPGRPGSSATPPASRSAPAPPVPEGTCCRGRGGQEARAEDSRARSARRGPSPPTRSAHAPPWPWTPRNTHHRAYKLGIL